MTRKRSKPFCTSSRKRRGYAVLSLCVGTALTISAGLMVVAAEPGQKHAKSAAAKPAADTYASQISPLMKRYCGNCHGATATAGLTFTTFKDTASVLKSRSTWEKVGEYLNSHHMPPVGQPQPTRAERDKLVAWIESTLSTADCKLQDPGRVTMRRLNREEYN